MVGLTSYPDQGSAVEAEGNHCLPIQYGGYIRRGDQVTLPFREWNCDFHPLDFMYDQSPYDWNERKGGEMFESELENWKNAF